MPKNLPASAIVFAVFLTACAIGPKDPNGTYADALNGDKSRSGVSVGGVLFISNPEHVQRRITGKVYCRNGILETPVRNAQVELKKDFQVIAQASQQEEGTFVINASFDRNTKYNITVKTPCGVETKPVPLNLLSDLTDFDFHLSQPSMAGSFPQ